MGSVAMATAGLKRNDHWPPRPFSAPAETARVHTDTELCKEGERRDFEKGKVRGLQSVNKCGDVGIMNHKICIGHISDAELCEVKGRDGIVGRSRVRGCVGLIAGNAGDVNSKSAYLASTFHSSLDSARTFAEVLNFDSPRPNPSLAPPAASCARG